MTQIAIDALTRARSSSSLENEMLVFSAFSDRGIPAEEIRPRDNCLTFHAWKALGRSVKKGEHGVRITTWIPTFGDADPKTGERPKTGVRPKIATVFHESQTQPIVASN